MVRAGLYVMTVHGQEEMEADALILDDVERVLLTGEIVERQKDERTGEAKYVVERSGSSEDRITVVAKIGPSGRLVIITVYRSPDEDE